VNKVISLQNVSLVRNGASILQNVNWEVTTGEHWAVLGPNGAGKTMLMKVITGYEWPSNGTVNVLSQQFGETDLSELRKKIGFVSGDLEQRMVDKNIPAQDVVLSGHFGSIGLYDKVSKTLQKQAEKLLRRVGLVGKAKQPFSLLSSGEKRRILIARSLMADPKLLLLDEPCAGLDKKSRTQFLELINKLAGVKNGPTVVFVTHHDDEIVPSITNVLRLEKGKRV